MTSHDIPQGGLLQGPSRKIIITLEQIAHSDINPGLWEEEAVRGEETCLGLDGLIGSRLATFIV